MTETSLNPASMEQILTVSVLGMIFLLVLIIKFKLHAFVSLLITSILVGIGCGMDPVQIIETIKKGMGGTLGFVAVVVGLGAMFGRMLEVSGGAERLALDLVNRCGEKNAQWALGLTGFLIAIPVFLDVGLIIVMPLVIQLTQRTGKPLLYYGIPLLAGLAVTHAFIPPTPGPIAVADQLGVDLGWVILFGFITGLPAMAIAGPLFGRYIAKKIPVGVPEGHEAPKDIKEEDLPSFFTTIMLIAIPMALIFMSSILKAIYDDPDTLISYLILLGDPFIALTIATLLTFYILGKHKGFTSEQVQEISTKALEPAGIIILITGAGGVFKQTLIDSGIAKQLGAALQDSNMPPVVLAFIISTIVRVAQGSATVAMITTGGIMSALITTMGLDLSPQILALVVISIASGATFCSHVNDSGFWLVNRFFGLSVKDTLKSWTVMESIVGLVGFGMALLLSLFF
jgi:Gnt-I system low-affinity gluconate transporter